MFCLLLGLTLLFFASAIELNGCNSFKSCEECANSSNWLGLKCEWCASDNSCVPFFFNSCPLTSQIEHAYNCPCEMPKDIVYDEEFVKEKILPLIAGANEDDPTRLQKLLNCPFENVTVGNVFEVPCDLLNTTKCHAYTAVVHSEKAIVISFRGTQGIPQLLLQGIDFFVTKATTPFAPTGGRVFNYYYQAFHRLWDSKIAKDLVNYTKLFPDYEVWSVGHSLGGGLASLGAAAVVGNGFRSSDKVKMINFGQPRIGDRYFAEGHDRLVPFSFRIINIHDPVPAIPSVEPIGSPVDGPFHHRHEVWYPKGMEPGAEFTVSLMAEDRSGFDAIQQFNVEDHLFYFGKDLPNWPKTAPTC
ncbi:hypothetical protein QR680_011739 [Steinernema hermaphroditum]|uniref:Fungal lipase-type domain-containing protein n=1 Tax=Steinernema hermaphroditum TaxID=289476 RepID=A0AA39LZ88_9BILA|nr:hypothetical protein QR680_011739 [Steinernema hermaphroditum]